MIYMVTRGAYDDYGVQALLDGPADLDMHQLFLQHFREGGDLDFIAWLCAHHNFQSASSVEVHIDSLGLAEQYGFGHNYPVQWPSVLWGAEPSEPDCTQIGRQNFFGGVHSWTRLWDGKGKRWWECYHCHKVMPVDAAIGVVPPAKEEADDATSRS